MKLQNHLLWSGPPLRIIRPFLLCLTGLFMASMVCAQSLTGTITDQAGEPIIGANVLVAGTDVGTVSDIDGSFSEEK